MSEDVTVTFTGPQAEALHSALSLILNDPDWADMLGGRREFATLARAHERLNEGRRP